MPPPSPNRGTDGPPTPAEQEAFLADKSLNAYEKVIERLLASERYGERWGRHWLDAAGYADSEGILDADYVRSGKADKWETAIFTAEKNATMPIPPDVFLPCIVEHNGHESRAVYKIKNSAGDARATMEIYSADGSMPLTSGTVIKRVARRNDGSLLSREIARVVHERTLV